VKSQNLLPKRVVNYIHEIGVCTLDHLAEHTKSRRNGSADAVQELVDRWKSMTDEEKEAFVNRVVSSVIEVVAVSAALPLGLKATKKALKRQKKKLKNAASRASAAGNLKKKSKAKAKDKPKNKPAEKPKKNNTG
jgi:hypothetical protein